MKKSVFIWLAVIALMDGVQAKTCNVSSGGLAFGLYNPASATNRNVTGSVVITCDKKIKAELSLSVGNGRAASYSGGRKMTRTTGGGTLTYNLYIDLSRTLVFGDGTDSSVTSQVNEKDTFSQPVYGRIPGAQRTTLSGSYLDTVVVTIKY